ncbi:MAG: BrnA antitoxin family protein [Firmicutes bacterium]|nr:BrnA antitoxin family protein [Bacillota bacterium]
MKELANARDIPYQSFMKVLLADGIKRMTKTR